MSDSSNPAGPQLTDAAITPPKPDVTFDLELITPQVAAEFLLNMGDNRSEKKNAQKVYTGDMKTDHWWFTGEPIIFDTSKKMRDGQNRCKSIIASGKPQWILVVRGIEPHAVDAIDIGVPRRFADVLAMRGEGINKRVASVTTRMYRWDVLGQRMSHLTGIISIQDMARYFEDENGDGHRREFISACAYESPKKIGLLMIPTVYGTCRVILRRVDFGDAESFLFQLVEGKIEDIDGRGRAIHAARARLLSDRQQTIHNRKVSGGEARDWPAGEVQRLIVFNAWNHWRKGRGVERIVLPRDYVRNYNMPL